LVGSARAVLVTGGAGYIGSHAAKALHAAGYRVVVYDDLSMGHRQAVRYGEFVQGDICDVHALRDVMRRHEVLAVMHFAAFLDVGESVREPVRYYRNNVGGALSVLEAMTAKLCVISCSRPPAPPTASRSKRRSSKLIRSGPSTATATRNWQWSGRCRTSSGRTISVPWRCATSTPPARIPTAKSARIILRRSI
jgi:uncharacterized protein YbjT (DUF2867 family)